nr:16S rRNA (guanine(966)-N(2))-methyltransferase RsmD [Spiroplasma tabanidicola]
MDFMRVISGKYRGRMLKTIEGKNTRPTSARLKEDIFNILNNYFIFENKTSLDLFAGSGALSIECLSRGIKFAYINDTYKQILPIIKENLAKIDESNYKLSSIDYLSLLKYLDLNQKKIDLIFIDPPYGEIDYYNQALNYLKNSNLLNNYAIIVVECEKPIENEYINKFVLLKHKVFKNKNLYVLRLENDS